MLVVAQLPFLTLLFRRSAADRRRYGYRLVRGELPVRRGRLGCGEGPVHWGRLVSRRRFGRK